MAQHLSTKRFIRNFLVYLLVWPSYLLAADHFDLAQQAEIQKKLCEDYKSPDQLIPEDLRTIYNPKINATEQGLGCGVLRIFQTSANKEYVIAGLRFGKHSKITVGGAVETSDYTMEDTLKRELKEELFNQLPMNEINIIGQPIKAGGYVQKEENWISKGWGPYFTFVALETGYSLKALEKAIEIININAALHFPVATFFAHIEDLSEIERKNQAITLLEAFEKTSLKPQELTPLTDEAQLMLKKISIHPSSLPNEGGWEFARKHVHAYTEYSHFYIQEFLQYQISDAPKFTGEADALKAAADYLKKRKTQ